MGGKPWWWRLPDGPAAVLVPSSCAGFFGDTGPDMDMGVVRAVQKRLACLLHVGHLPEAVRAELHAALADCQQQQRCNEAVDQVGGLPRHAATGGQGGG